MGFLQGGTVLDAVASLSPLVLSGIVLAGANDSDRLLAANSYLTAEEVAGLDLRKCDLAILSACKTNVGLSIAGQSIASLQTAFHSAGAKQVITSLWDVPDAETQALMEEFYRLLWEEGQRPASALWIAKRRLMEGKCAKGVRADRLYDWAGWVLSGSA